MKKYKNIDDLFKEGAAGFTIEPSAGLFDEIVDIHLRAKRRKRKAIYFWSLVAFFLLALGVSGWFFLNNGQIEGTGEVNKVVTQRSLVNEIEKESKQIVKENLHRKDGQEIFQEEGVVSYKKNSPMDGSHKLNENELEFVPGDSETKSNLIIKEEIEHSLTNNSSYSFKENVAIIEMSCRSISEIAQTKPNSIDPRTVTGMEKYLEKRNNLHFYTGFGGTVSKVYYPDTEDQYIWSADMALGLKIHDLYIESGVGYQQMNERGIYQIDFKSNDSIGYFNEVISFEIDPQNPEEITYKTKETTVYDSISHYTHTTPLFEYSYINIPLKMGYRFFEKDKLSVAAEAGVIFSWMVSKQIPDVILNNPDYELLSITNQTPERVEVNYQWQLSLRLNYRFAKSMSVAAQPVFTKYINSIYDTKSGYSNVKPYTMGIRFGVYFDF